MGRFLTYELKPLLREGTVLTLDLQLQCLYQHQEGTFLEGVHLSLVERDMIRALLDNFPDYASAQSILAAFSHRTEEDCLTELNKSIDTNSYDLVMQPARNLLSRTRERIRLFNIEIKAIIYTGYILVPYRAHFVKRSA